MHCPSSSLALLCATVKGNSRYLSSHLSPTQPWASSCTLQGQSRALLPDSSSSCLSLYSSLSYLALSTGTVSKCEGPLGLPFPPQEKSLQGLRLEELLLESKEGSQFWER